jgi:hypothetical protein
MTRTLRRALLASTLCASLLLGGQTLSAQISDNPQKDSTLPAASAPRAVTGTSQQTPTTGSASVASAPTAPVRRGKSFQSALSSESQTLDHITVSYLHLIEDGEFLKILSSPNRQPIIAVPYGSKGRGTRALTTMRGLASPTLARSFTSDSSLGSLVRWYAQQYGFEFKVRTTPLDGAGDTLMVARAVRQIGNTVVSIMIWNPTQSGRTRKAAGKLTRQTSVEIQERAFRPREELIVEGPDAVVELTWAVPYRDLIQKISIKYQIDPFLLAALVQQESGFNAGAMSVDSAMGLTQMIPATAEMMGISNPHDPHQALDGGARYLKLMLQRFRGDVKLALAAYNAGPGNVEKYHGIPPFAETRDYVKRIMARYQEKAGGDRALIAQTKVKVAS